MQRVLVLVIGVAGCGFQLTGPGVVSDAPSERATDGPLDALVDAPAVAGTCFAAWYGNAIRFGTAVALTTVNSSSFERDPFLTPDELTLFVSTARPGRMGGDTWMATRTTTLLPFGAPVRFPPFSTAGNETKVSIAMSSLVAMVGSDQAGGAGGVDVWETSRATTTAAWGPLTRTHVMAANSGGSDHDPMISADGLHLYTAPDAPGVQHIALATRPNTTANFSASTTIAELDSTMSDGDPSVSADERLIVFYSGRTSAFTGGNLWYATRASATAAFGTPRIVPDVNTNFNDGDPHVSEDGCRLYFGRDGSATDWDLYVATAQ